MRRRLAILFACALACPSLAAAQTPPDGVTILLQRLETLLQSGSPDSFSSLVSSTFPQEEVNAFARDLFTPNARRAVVVENDRVPLAGVPPGDGYRLVAELFTETGGRARIVTTLFDVKRVPDAEPTGPQGPALRDEWRITAAQSVASINDLFRLRVDASKQFLARNLSVTAEDLTLTLTDGSAFIIASDEGVTGLVLFGRGIIHFAPEPPTERGQLRIFAGNDDLTTGFDAAFVRLNPVDYERRVTVDRMTPVPVNPRDLRRAEELLEREGAKSFNVDLHELSSEPWFLLPSAGDFLAEIRTRRYGTLTYSRAATQVEDITLFNRERNRTIALYPSAQRRAARGLSFNEDDLRDYDVLDYDIETAITPGTEFLEGRTRLHIRVRTAGASSLMLRLSDELGVRGVVSVEYGRLLHLRVRGQDSVIVNFPAELKQNAEITLLVTYAGHIPTQKIEDEGVQVGEEPFGIPPETNFLLSSRSFWYPQNPIPDYATGTLRIVLPEGFDCVASGDPRGSDQVTLRDLLSLTNGRTFVFTAANPLRYFAVIVSRFVHVADDTLLLPPDIERPKDAGGVRVSVDANPRQLGNARTLLGDTKSIMAFYAGLLGDVPYSSLSVALVEHELPGGHSPAYFAVLNSPVPSARTTWRGDPASFPGFQEFFVAHELAHQWWGHAVGWRNYHDQWLSEGLAQYFAALYAQHVRGDRAFERMLRQFRRWAVAESDEGPVSLGSRLGHLRREPRVFRALVYNKGAAVLHMLRRLVGDEHFFGALRRFYRDQKFQKAGTLDLRAAFEVESGRSLERFFDRWIYNPELPRLRYTTELRGNTVTVRFEQVGDILFDIPVTVTLIYADGRIEDVVVPVTESRVEWHRSAASAVRQVQVNRDYAAVALFERF